MKIGNEVMGGRCGEKRAVEKLASGSHQKRVSGPVRMHTIIFSTVVHAKARRAGVLLRSPTPKWLV